MDDEISQKDKFVVFIIGFLFLSAFSSLALYCFEQHKQANKPLEFLELAEQSATVAYAKESLKKGLPLLEQEIPDSSQLELWKANLAYLKTQPERSLLQKEMAKSIEVNAKKIREEIDLGESWKWLVTFALIITSLAGSLLAYFSFSLISSE